MKVLIWNDHDGSFCSDPQGQTHPIRDISEQDVLAIMRLILHDPASVEMDPLPTDRDNVDQAALVIYEELSKQFASMIAKRDIVIARIDKKFEEARSYYNQDDVQDLFDTPKESGARD
jgi:hypothetical protein